jgi:RNA 3'-terminal phosphate cyclase (ATP)
VADEVCDRVEILLSSQACMDEFLADQLLLPLALAKSETFYSTVRITKHLRTNADVIKTFINPGIEITGNTGSSGTVRIFPNIQ